MTEYAAWRRALEILPIMPALCSMRFNARMPKIMLP